MYFLFSNSGIYIAIRKLRKRIQFVIIIPAHTENASEVACDDKHVFLCQAILLLDFSKAVYIAVCMLLVLSLIVFLMVRMIPGDPVKNMPGIEVPQEMVEVERERLGLNDPLPVQYLRFMNKLLHGGLGTSIVTGKPVFDELMARYPNTLILAFGGIVVAAIGGVLVGILASLFHNRFWENFIMVLSMLAVSTPSFFLALILMLVFTLNLRWFPSVCAITPARMALPIVTLGTQAIGFIARTTRSAMLDLGRDTIHPHGLRGAGFAVHQLHGRGDRLHDRRADGRMRGLLRAMGIAYLPLTEVMAKSDIVSIHTPNDTSTRRLISREMLALMKPTALLINCARGPIVDSAALAEALNEGRLAGAGVDVFNPEPPIPDSEPLLHARNALLTPHIAFASRESMLRRARIVFHNIEAYLAGKPENVCRY